MSILMQIIILIPAVVLLGTYLIFGWHTLRLMFKHNHTWVVRNGSPDHAASLFVVFGWPLVWLIGVTLWIGDQVIAQIDKLANMAQEDDDG